MGGDEPTIEYSVRELIERIDQKVDQFITLMNAKADRAEVTLLEEKVELLGTRLASLEHRLDKEERELQERKDHRRWLIPTLLTAILAFTSVAVLLHL